jgi:hypothetical protein
VSPERGCTSCPEPVPSFPGLGTITALLELEKAPPVVSVAALEPFRAPSAAFRAETFVATGAGFTAPVDRLVDFGFVGDGQRKPTPGFDGEFEWRGLRITFGKTPATDQTMIRWFWKTTAREYVSQVSLKKL